MKELITDQKSKLKDYLKYEDEETKLSEKNFRYIIYKS